MADIRLQICYYDFYFFIISEVIIFLFIDRLVCDDITEGLEDIPIPVTNLVDDPPIKPPGPLSYLLWLLNLVDKCTIINIYPS